MKRAWICMTRIPEAGRTKTRLMPLLSGAECAALHTAFLCDLAVLSETVDADFFVTYTPGEGWEQLEEIFPTAKALFPQEGEDLGARMHNAILRVLAMGYDACILTGSDLPDLTAAHLESGFAALGPADVTLGPTADGGYYLVGLKAPCPVIFEKQTYGISTVFDATCAAAEKAGCTVAKALPCDDVDTPDELRALWKQCRGKDSHTARCLGTIFAKEERK